MDSKDSRDLAFVADKLRAVRKRMLKARDAGDRSVKAKTRNKLLRAQRMLREALSEAGVSQPPAPALTLSAPRKVRLLAGRFR